MSPTSLLVKTPRVSFNRVVFTPFLQSISYTEDIAKLVESTPAIILDILARNSQYYRTFQIPKKKGGVRTITAPIKKLRGMQRILKEYLDSHIKWPKYLHGGIEGRSTISNAQLHIGQPLVSNLDVKDFFPSISEEKVSQLFLQFGATSEIANQLARFCCYESRIPQGAPTSTLLANLAFAPIDAQILMIIRKGKFNYSRYIDDISISGSDKIPSFMGHIDKVIRSNGYKLSLLNYRNRSQRQTVTGLIVNDKLKPTNEYISDLEADIRACLDKNIGPDIASCTYGLTMAKLKKNIKGRISHLLQFKAEKSKKLLRLARGINWYSTN